MDLVKFYTIVVIKMNNIIYPEKRIMMDSMEVINARELIFQGRKIRPNG